MAITTPQTNPRTILLRGELHKVQTEGYVQATKSIIPGMLVEPGTGGANPYKHYQPHATQGEVTEPLVALEPMIADVPFATFQGGTIDDTYAAGDHLRVHYAQPGDELYMFLKASGSAVIEGDFLQSAGNGDLEKVTTTNARLFTALEAKTPTAARTRVRVRRV
jgi:hypothetical protein